MKRLIFIVLLLLTLATSCLSDQSNEPMPNSLDAYSSSGTFSGEFRRISIEKVGTIDTLRANIKLVIEAGTRYQVLGDTTTIHAGSKGHYSISGSRITFVDDTYPKTGTPVKIHLNGEYQFIFNGSIFQIAGLLGDTVNVQYDLKRAM